MVSLQYDGMLIHIGFNFLIEFCLIENYWSY